MTFLENVRSLTTTPPLTIPDTGTFANDHLDIISVSKALDESQKECKEERTKKPTLTVGNTCDSSCQPSGRARANGRLVIFTTECSEWTEQMYNKTVMKRNTSWAARLCTTARGLSPSSCVAATSLSTESTAWSPTLTAPTDLFVVYNEHRALE